MDRAHQFMSIVHATYGEKEYVGNFHHVKYSEFGEFYQLFFYKVIDLDKTPPLMETCDIYVSSPGIVALYKRLMPKARVWLVSEDELRATYAHGAGVDIATGRLETQTGPVRSAKATVVAENPVYGFGEFFTTLDNHFGNKENVEDGIDGSITSEVKTEGSLVLADGKKLQATKGLALPATHIYWGPPIERAVK